MFVTFIIILSHFLKFDHYRDTRAYILDPCIRELSLQRINFRSQDIYTECQIIDLQEKSLFRTYAFALPKDSPFTEIFNHYISKMHAKGFLSKIKTKYEIKPQRCPDFNGLPLTYANCGTAFIFLAFGFIFGFILLGIEIVLKKYGYQLNFNQPHSDDCEECNFKNQLLLKSYVSIDQRDSIIQKMALQLQRISQELDEIKKGMKL